jgi:hypothetical protein
MIKAGSYTPVFDFSATTNGFPVVEGFSDL